MFKWIKVKAKQVWTSIRLFFHALWVSIALFFGGQLLADQEVAWSWTAPTEYVDKLYCNGNAAIDIPNVLNFTKSVSPGTYVCYVTVVAHGIESDPSNSAV